MMRASIAAISITALSAVIPARWQPRAHSQQRSAATPPVAAQSYVPKLGVKQASAHALVDSAIVAMGGMERLRAVRSIRVEGAQHEYLAGNAERADGPWKTYYTHYTQLTDFKNLRIRRNSTGTFVFSPVPRVATLIISDSAAALIGASGKPVAAQSSQYVDATDRMDADPIRAVQLASVASDLRRNTPDTLFREVYDVVSFAWRGGRMRLLLDQHTHLPGANIIDRAYPEDLRRSPFGDIHLMTVFADWQAQPTGLWYPRQSIVTVNGVTISDGSVYNFAENSPAPDDSFDISATTRGQFQASRTHAFSQLKLNERGAPVVIRDGIVSLRDFWTTTLVRQDDGIVVFEAHISPEYASQIIAEAHRRFPGLPIKALVLSSDPWAHLGGVREFVARGIPIYLLDSSKPFIDGFLRSPHTMHPDSLQRAPRRAIIRAVSGRTVVGAGRNQFVLYPVRGSASERMVMAYFPTYRFLYGADLVSPNPGAAGSPTTYDRTEVAELRRAVAREGVAVDSVFCVQSPKMVAWDAYKGGE